MEGSKPNTDVRPRPQTNDLFRHHLGMLYRVYCLAELGSDRRLHVVFQDSDQPKESLGHLSIIRSFAGKEKYRLRCGQEAQFRLVWLAPFLPGGVPDGWVLPLEDFMETLSETNEAEFRFTRLPYPAEAIKQILEIIDTNAPELNTPQGCQQAISQICLLVADLRAIARNWSEVQKGEG